LETWVNYLPAPLVQKARAQGPLKTQKAMQSWRTLPLRMSKLLVALLMWSNLTMMSQAKRRRHPKAQPTPLVSRNWAVPVNPALAPTNV
jgi:hypothetical protein